MHKADGISSVLLQNISYRHMLIRATLNDCFACQNGQNLTDNLCRPHTFVVTSILQDKWSETPSNMTFSMVLQSTGVLWSGGSCIALLRLSLKDCLVHQVLKNHSGVKTFFCTLHSNFLSSYFLKQFMSLLTVSQISVSPSYQYTLHGVLRCLVKEPYLHPTVK